MRGGGGGRLDCALASFMKALRKRLKTEFAVSRTPLTTAKSPGLLRELLRELGQKGLPLGGEVVLADDRERLAELALDLGRGANHQSRDEALDLLLLIRPPNPQRSRCNCVRSRRGGSTVLGREGGLREGPKQ